MSFGKKLKEIRKQHRLSQTEISNKLIMDQSSYSRYENDKTIPTIDIINRVVAVFGVSLDWIMEVGQVQKNNTSAKNIQTNNDYVVSKYIIEDLLKQQTVLTGILQKILEQNNKDITSSHPTNA
jgi:transcriptional regulator with XRE-family HTH domain